MENRINLKKNKTKWVDILFFILIIAVAVIIIFAMIYMAFVFCDSCVMLIKCLL